MIDAPQFLFATCQIGAESALKNEFKREWPGFKLAFSRPGFLTFKLPPQQIIGVELHSTFARTSGFTLGKVTGETPDELAIAARQMAGDSQSSALFVWQRDTAPIGFHGFELGLTDAVAQAQPALERQFTNLPIVTPNSHIPRSVGSLREAYPTWRAADTPDSGDLVLDCIIVEPNEWWLGYHQVRSIPTRWPGGIFTVAKKAEIVSRAYIKMLEALAWSRLPLRRGDTIAEIGSAPGGASQALLEKGFSVIGIDPAAMDERVLAHSRFTHIQKRGHEVRRRQFRGVRWLAADINVAPAYTLDTVEGIVTHASVTISGLLLTLKLLEWNLADELPAYLERIRSWGYTHVVARQLSHNRQEVCVAALRKK